MRKNRYKSEFLSKLNKKRSKGQTFVEFVLLLSLITLLGVFLSRNFTLGLAKLWVQALNTVTETKDTFVLPASIDRP